MSKASLKELYGYAGLLGLILIGAAAAYYLVNGELTLVVRILAGVGVACVVLYIWTNPQSIREAMLGNKARYGSNTIAAVLAFIAIIGLFNYIVAKNSQRWDLTANKSFTLSEQTLKIASELKEPIRVTGFIKTGEYGRVEAEDLLKQLAEKTDKISYEFIDPDLNPTKTIEYQATYGSLIFQSGNKRQEVTGYEESDFTRAMLRLSSEEQKQVYFLTGHGERVIDDADADGYSFAKQILESDNFVVSTINFTTSPTSTENIDVLVVADPQTALLADEKKLLQDFMEKGGKVLFLTDAMSKSPIDEYLTTYGGIKVAMGVVIDPGSSSLNDPAMIAIQRYPFHAITKDTRAMTVLPYATSLALPRSNEKVTITTLAESTDRSWLETDERVARFDEGKDTKGPLTIAAAIETAPVLESGVSKKTRVVIVGDSDFASNQFIQNVGNADLFANTINWLSESEEMISVRPKPREDNAIFLTSIQKNGIMLSTLVLLPLTVLVTGAVVWWRRR